MDKASLMQFLKRILGNGSAEKSAASLGQLRDILKAQNADVDMIRLVEATLANISEAKHEVIQTTFSEATLRTALERAQRRKQREAEMADRGRC